VWSSTCGHGRTEGSGQRQSFALGVSGAALVVAGFVVESWMPVLLLLGFVLLGAALALDAPSDLSTPDDPGSDALWSWFDNDRRTT
jgi:hypothetical protein